MSTIEIRKISIVDLKTDVIVNAANDRLLAGGGVCGAIFKAAGYDELQSACNKIGYCPSGSAVITPAFNLHANFIIHAVGPHWIDGKHDEPKLLYGAYRRSLELAAEYNCHSIGFPLISAGIFGYPVKDAWRKAIQSCQDFITKHTETGLDIVFAVLDDGIQEIGQKTLMEIAPESALESSFFISEEHKLRISGKEFDAVFFHKPEEPDGYLSNWYKSPFILDGIRFSSVERYIMYQKCLIFDDYESAKAILMTDDNQEQQDIGRAAAGYNDYVWTGMRQLVAMKGLLAKFTQNEDLKQRLLETGDAYLVECAVSDTKWACGIGLYDKRRQDTSYWKGTNILGFALMDVRRIIRES